MTAGAGGVTPDGMDRVWRLTSRGYRIVDVDSDDLFVGIRLERGGESLTLLLTREDFTGLFPNVAAATRGLTQRADPTD